MLNFKHFTVLLTLCFCLQTSCKSKKGIQKEEHPLHTLNEKLNKALASSDGEMVITLCSPTYVSEQLEFLQNNREQFLRELFCAYNKESTFGCPGISGIESIEFLKWEPTSYDNGYDIDFTINLKQKDSTNSKTLNRGSIHAILYDGKWLLVGAMG